MVLEREGIEEGEVEEDVENKDEEIIQGKDEEIIPTEDEVKEQEKRKKGTIVGQDPKYKQDQYHSTLELGQLAKRKRMK